MARIEKFLGLRNTVVPERQPPGALATAVNVDLDDSGAIVRRDGSVSVHRAGTLTAAYAMRDQRSAYIVQDGALWRMNAPDAPALAVEATPEVATVPSSPMFWAEAGDYLFLSTAGYKALVWAGRAIPWGIPVAPEPSALAVNAGQMPPGIYQVAVVRVDATGRQGPASTPITVENSFQGGALSILVPTLTGYSLDLYVSECNGQTLYRVARVPEGIPSVTWAGSETLGYELDPVLLDTLPPPDGGPIAFHESRLWIAVYDPASDTSAVFFSQPFFWHLFNLGADYLPIPGQVLGLAAVNDELLIATDKDIWRRGVDGQMTRLRQFGAIPGYPITIIPADPPNQPFAVALVWTLKGWFRYSPETPLGDDLTRDIFQMPPGSRCVTAYLERSGSRYALAITDPGGTAYGL